MNLNLADQLSGHVFQFMLIFTRLGAGLMMFPGIGEAFVTPRIRMLFALSFSFLLMPVLMSRIPAMPAHIGDLVMMIVIEATVGLFFGVIMRLMMDIVETAGAIIAMEIGLSNAMILNPTLASQSALPSAFLGVAGIAALFLTDMDHFLFRALMDTYNIFPVGQALPFGDFVESFTHIITRSFSVGVQLASPFMILGLLLYVALGMVQRMMPQVQLFLVVMPVQIWVGFAIFAATISAMMSVWLNVYDNTVAELFIR